MDADGAPMAMDEGEGGRATPPLPNFDHTTIRPKLTYVPHPNPPYLYSAKRGAIRFKKKRF